MLAKRFAIGLAIALIFPLLMHYGVSSIVSKPRWKDYHSNDQYIYAPESTPEEREKHLKRQEEQTKKYQEQNDRFETTLFYVSVPLGIAAVIAGALLTFQAVGAGLMFGGVFALVNAYFVYWSTLSDAVKFISLLMALVIFISIAYRKLNVRAGEDEGKPPAGNAGEGPPSGPLHSVSQKIPHMDDPGEK